MAYCVNVRIGIDCWDMNGIDWMVGSKNGTFFFFVIATACFYIYVSSVAFNVADFERIL